MTKEKKAEVVIPRSVKIPNDLNNLLNKYLFYIDESFSQYVIELIREDVTKNIEIKMKQRAAEINKDVSAIKKKKA